MSSPSTFSDKWDQSRHELLDLTFRNPLLNYRALKSRGLQFDNVLLTEIHALLLAEKSLRLVSLDDSVDAKPGATLCLKTPYVRDELEKRALKTYYDARSSLEEQGINTLFLAFGFLKWYEADNSEVAHRSPLFLLPVELKREKVGRGFELRATGEEGGINLSLATLFKRDLRLELPAWEEDKEMDIPRYFGQVREAIKLFPRFEIEENLASAFFSFAKFLMFRDLEAQTSEAEQHQIIGSLLGAGFGRTTDRISDGEKLDKKLPVTQQKVVTDADSSQMLAIEDARIGHNLVIQGPPGTGKSQTITNIIAQAIAQKRTVLFASEKMAALQVVKSRLDALGLGDACLELHSNKTNKKSLLGELKRTFDLPRPARVGEAENAELLGEAVHQLNVHAEAINTPLENSGLTLHQIYGSWLQNDRCIKSKSLVVPNLNEANLAQKSAGEIARLRSLIAQMQDVLQRSGPIKNHPFSRSNLRVFLPTEARTLHDRFREAHQLMAEVSKQSLALARALNCPSATKNADVKNLTETAKAWRDAPDLEGADLKNAAWSSQKIEIEGLLKSGETLRDLKRNWGARLRPDAWRSDINSPRTALESHGRKWFRFLIGSWREAQKQVALLTIDAAPKTLEEQLQILDAIAQFKNARATFATHRALGKTLFGANWNDLESDFAAFSTVQKWIEAVHQKQHSEQLLHSFFDLESPLNKDSLQVCITLEPIISQLEASQEAIRNSVGWADLLPDDWNALESQWEEWEKNLKRLGEIAAFNGLSSRLHEENLASFDALARGWDEARQGLALAFERAHLESLLNAGMRRFPHLSHFNGPSQEKLATDFCARDRVHLQQTSRTIALRHFDAIQSCNAESEMKILRREWEKQRAHLAPRRLISRIPQTLQIIKPVLMMSPLSVATYLPANDLKFDLVIFDEASQVRPVEAFGALLRGRQAIVAGDSNQLPPTSFFDKFVSDSEDEGDETDINAKDLESILGLFVAQGAPERMLRWHYRSRHESLIAVSNREFYDDKLIVFPSPDAARSEMGLICRLMPDTVYRASINREEAKAVAKAVIEHARIQLTLLPEKRRTLGVAAFSVKQAQEIQDQLEVLRRQNENLESFFALDDHEPFFVKNLENVQGDERDVMFLSVGYGRDEHGKAAMRFGPLGNTGGERRLNVLISRARLRCEVFTNMRADDLDLNRTNSIGVRALKQFLSYAQNGDFALSLPTGREMDSPFEEEVLRAIESLGYCAVPQVGCAGYFIDLSVQDPTTPGRYILGVECDGASYHSAASARDRDRLRAQVLRNMGWTLHRIWSTDWFQNRSTEIQRLKQAIELAVNQQNQNSSQVLESEK